MIAVDTNILVYAHRKDSDFHVRARACLADLARGNSTWAIPWSCVHEFFAIVTHPRIYAPPSTQAQAIAEIESWLASPSCQLLAEDEGYWPLLSDNLQNGVIAGPQVHDARIASICVLHGVRELLSADRDFSRFARLKTRNPLV